ncbi:hypothetical protein MD484_g3847, partial [Candolleomyces efflorescens]
MDPALQRKIVDVSDEELTALGFLGPSVAPDVEVMTLFQADCLRRTSVRAPTHDATKSTPPRSEVDVGDVLLSNNPDALVSAFEQRFWYHGISSNPPKLLYRSDLETNPFPTPTPGTRFFNVPIKTAHGVFRRRLNAVWDTVAPLILEVVKAHGIQYSALMTARFSTSEVGQEQETYGPAVVWIAVRPGTTNAEALRDVTPEILAILAKEDITDVVVEWTEGTVERLVDLPPKNAEDNDSPDSTPA